MTPHQLLTLVLMPGGVPCDLPNATGPVSPLLQVSLFRGWKMMLWSRLHGLCEEQFWAGGGRFGGLLVPCDVLVPLTGGTSESWSL